MCLHQITPNLNSNYLVQNAPHLILLFMFLRFFLATCRLLSPFYCSLLFSSLQSSSLTPLFTSQLFGDSIISPSLIFSSLLSPSPSPHILTFPSSPVYLILDIQYWRTGPTSLLARDSSCASPELSSAKQRSSSWTR